MKKYDFLFVLSQKQNSSAFDEIISPFGARTYEIPAALLEQKTRLLIMKYEKA